MRKERKAFLVFATSGVLIAALLGVGAYSSHRRTTDAAGDKKPAESVSETPADARIRAGENRIKLAPNKPDGYNLLASAYTQKARETGDFSFNAKAEQALARSLAIAPDNYDALKLRAKLLLIYHRFSEALLEAQRAQSSAPEDHDLYGVLTDAYVELGDYEQAVKSAQKMVDLRPDAASYSRVAYLRSLHGDIEGAIEAMDVAVKAADPRDPEGVAWYRVHLGEELARAGRPVEAEAQYDKALLIFPNYRLALAAKARARAAVGDYQKAIEIYQRESSHDALLGLGDVYAKLNRMQEAAQMYDAFEAAERQVAAQENDMSHLARFWADQGRNLDEALAVMQNARAKRADLYTCDTLAWVLYKKGQFSDAEKAIRDALRLGTRDPKINYHAGMIYNALGKSETAAKHLQLALKTSPYFDLLATASAEQTLAAIKAKRSPTRQLVQSRPLPRTVAKK